MSETYREMPKYTCHKEVWALKIAKIVSEDIIGQDKGLGGGAMIFPAENGYASFHVDRDYVKKHCPQIGGYYVVYEDGYKSYSPAKAFENGYKPKN